MAKELGWIKIHRKIQDTSGYFAEPFCRNMAWIDLLLLANHEDNFFFFFGIRIDVKRGQTGVVIETFCTRWKWSRGKVERFLKELELDNKIVRQKNNITTLISIINYSQYQDNDKAESKANSKANEYQTVKQTITQTDTNKNDKNIKNDKEVLFNTMALAENFNGLPSIKLGSVIELLKITKQTTVTEDDVKGLWEVFKIQNLTGKKYYANSDAVYSHFINWSKNQKFEKHGKSKTSTVGKELKFDRP